MTIEDIGNRDRRAYPHILSFHNYNIKDICSTFVLRRYSSVRTAAGRPRRGPDSLESGGRWHETGQVFFYLSLESWRTQERNRHPPAVSLTHTLRGTSSALNGHINLKAIFVYFITAGVLGFDSGVGQEIKIYFTGNLYPINFQSQLYLSFINYF